MWKKPGSIVASVVGVLLLIATVIVIANEQWGIPAQPFATVMTGLAAITTALIALHNGERARDSDRKQHNDRIELEKSQFKKTMDEQKAQFEKTIESENKKHQERVRTEQERALRERFTSIVEMLSDTHNLAKREAAAYAMGALFDDWAKFHENDNKAAAREQQVCLNVIAGQLLDPITDETEDDNPKLLVFKKRIQEIIFSRFRSTETTRTTTKENSAKARAKNAQWASLKLDLTGCHLHEAIITGDFKKEVSFKNVNFNAPTRFDGAKFSKPVDFTNAKFTSLATFEETNFDQEASFDGAKFQGWANFTTTTFNGDTSFYMAKFNRTAGFTNVEFHQQAHLCQSKFAERVDFISTRFHERANFEYVTFPNITAFTKSEFLAGAQFSGAHFNGDTLFDSTNFRRSSDFSDTHFNCKTSFKHAVFHEKTSLYASFNETPDFSEAKFRTSMKEEIERLKGGDPSAILDGITFLP